MRKSVWYPMFIKCYNANRDSKAEISKQVLGIIVLVNVFISVLFSPSVAHADPWDSVATKVLSIFTGGITRTFAIIAVIACGIAALAGKLSWDWAIKIIVGIVLIFGSTAFVDFLISAAS
jgi:type IV secretory pathway VirB2 component (pilin)